MYYAKTKHIDIQYYKLRKYVANACIQLIKIPIQDNNANMMTKPLQTIKFLDLANIKQC